MEALNKLIQKRVKELCANKKFSDKQIYLFGYNEYTIYINNILHEQGYNLTGIIDNDKKKQGSTIFNILVSAPENIDWRDNIVVLIVSKHRETMENQIQRLSQKAEIYVLADLMKFINMSEKRDMFWQEENYRLELKKLYKGEEIYNNLKCNQKLVIILPALGDMFAVGLYLYEYEKKIVGRVKIVVSSQSVYNVAKLFGISNIEIISRIEMDTLIKYIFFLESGNEDICTCVNALDIIAEYKRLAFPKFWAKYYFRLKCPYKVYFPSIWDKKLEESILINQGLIKGKTVILAPYANSIEELPIQFWELLVERLLAYNYYVFTNIIGTQKPVKKSKAIEIPLNQIGNYLDYAGYFVSLRSGLCDVAGRSMCKKIVLFREQNYINHSPQIEFFDLYAEDISINVVQFLYKDNFFLENIDNVVNIILNT